MGLFVKEIIGKSGFSLGPGKEWELRNWNNYIKYLFLQGHFAKYETMGLFSTAQIYEVAHQYFQYLLYDFRHTKEDFLNHLVIETPLLCMTTANTFSYTTIELGTFALP